MHSRSATSRTLARLRIVSVNDVYELTNLPRLKTFLESLTDPRPSAVVLAGDFLSPSTLSSIDGGRGMVSTLRAIGMTHVSLGNHEQDLRLNTLRQRLEELSAPQSQQQQQQQPWMNPMTATATATTTATTPAATSKSGGSVVVVLNTNMQENLPRKATWMRSLTKPHALVASPCGSVTVALLGLISDEPGVFRDNTFKSVPIKNLLEAYADAHRELVETEPIRESNAAADAIAIAIADADVDAIADATTTTTKPVKVDLVLPLTHCSLVRDKELAQHMLSLHGGSGVIIGGHEHDPYHEIVTFASNRPNNDKNQYQNQNQNQNAGDGDGGGDDDDDDDDDSIHIVKSGMDARNACLVDLVFEVPSTAKTQKENENENHQSPPPNHDCITPDDSDADVNFNINANANANVNAESPRLVEIHTELVDLSGYKPAPCAQQIVDQHMSVVRALEDEIIIEADSIVSLPNGALFSSQRSRFQQTTMGGVFCQMIKEELEECDVALLNGAVVKGDSVYHNATMSYAQLKKELPFPTKIVVVEMTRCELNEAICYSRTALEPGIEAGVGDVPRRGYLQVDHDFDRAQQEAESNVASNADDADATATATANATATATAYPSTEQTTLRVALPRNLLNGFCGIKPLMAVGERLKQEGTFPGDDDFVPVIDLIVRHASKARWLQLATKSKNDSDFDSDLELDFEKFDLNGDAVLDKHEIKAMMTDALGYEPADFVVDDMVGAIDTDGNGTVDHDEFSRIVSQIERNNGRLPKE